MALTLSAQAAPDEVALGRDRGYPRGMPQNLTDEVHKIGSFSALADILPVREVRRGASPVWPLPPGDASLLEGFSYRVGDQRYTLEDYLSRRRVTSLLVAREGRLLLERYQYGRTAAHRFASFSMAKSITALLVGMAHERGLIRSLDDWVRAYAPELADSAYADITLRQLLRMSSGVRWEETYSGRDDVALLWAGLFRVHGGGNPTGLLAARRPSDFEPGTRFRYSTGETQVLCHVLHGATRRTVADLTEDWLWSRLGAEADAAWLVGWQGIEYCGGGFNATARDWLRLGLLLAAQGARGGEAIVPREFLLDATELSRQPPGFRLGEAYPGGAYGYQFWLGDAGGGWFAMIGVYGQMLMVAPRLGLVVTHTAAWSASSEPASRAERTAFLIALLRHVESRLAASGPPR